MVTSFITQSLAEINIVNAQMFHAGFPLPDLVLGASLYFPPYVQSIFTGTGILAFDTSGAA